MKTDTCKWLKGSALAVLFAAWFGIPSNGAELPGDLAWPTPTRENRPWTRWWWLGSAVDKTNLTRVLAEYRQAGLGGVEICPIYGAKGYESRFLDFLSPQWMEMLAHTTLEAKRLDLGVDLTTGTGWPFGGPNVTPDIASAKVVLKRFEVAGGASLKDDLPQGQLQCLRAVSETGEQLDLSAKVANRRLDWTAPPGQWRLYAVLQTSPVQKVKRAAPGGEGNVLDPYSVKALNQYLARFDQAFASYHGEKPRSEFHDSFEYYGAQWTTDFFREFEARRGYDLRTQLPALFGEGPEETVARVKGDYRETISDLHLAYIQRWTEWTHSQGSLSRDQAHGSPGNLLDIYAASDIPETEIFGSLDGQKMPLNKFSSSAAHVTGRKLASSESFTWLNEHFQASLAEVKPAADYLFLSGVNHIFFHGIPYTPAAAAWPGWQFYASVNFGPQGGLWHDLPEFNGYVTRCQSILQSGASANDILLYYSVHDVWNSPGDLIRPNPMSLAFTNAALSLWERGFAFDYLSDRFLAQARCDGHDVLLGGNAYHAVVVPECRVLPETSLLKLAQLAREGALIVFLNHVPADVPGFGELPQRRARFKEILAGLKLNETGPTPVGKGTILMTANVEDPALLKVALREPCARSGLSFVRRSHAGGFHYFLVNRSERPFDGWLSFATPLKSAVILDPRFANRIGLAALRPGRAAPGPPIYLQLRPGESCMVRTFRDRVVTGPAWLYEQPSGPPQPLAGAWQVSFIEGGPELPAKFETRELGSWTKLGDAEAKRFAGTAHYTLELETPAGAAADWLLDLGRVCESARVQVNGQDVGTLWCAPFQIPVGKYLHQGKNSLQVEVTNLAANRIADLDRRKVNWKYFYDINVASRRYRSLDASDWPPRDSGLLGPVTLTPMKTVDRL